MLGGGGKENKSLPRGRRERRGRGDSLGSEGGGKSRGVGEGRGSRSGEKQLGSRWAIRLQLFFFCLLRNLVVPRELFGF